MTFARLLAGRRRSQADRLLALLALLVCSQSRSQGCVLADLLMPGRNVQMGRRLYLGGSPFLSVAELETQQFQALIRKQGWSW